MDRFRIKIWEKFSGRVIYDNEMGVSDNAEPNTVIGGSNIGTKNENPDQGSQGKTDKENPEKGNSDKNNRFNVSNKTGIPISEKFLEGSVTLDLKVYPNPVQEKLYIDFQSNLDEVVFITMFGLTGRLLYEEKWPIVKGPNKIMIRIHSTNIRTEKLSILLMSPSTGFHNFILIKP